MADAFLEILKAGRDDNGRPSFDATVLHGVKIRIAEIGRVVCSMRVPSNLTNGYGTLHGGAIATLVDCVSSIAVVTMGNSNTGVTIDLSVTYTSAAKLHEELEIESKVLKMGKNVVMLWAELRKLKSGEVLASGHHTKYFPSSSTLASKL